MNILVTGADGQLGRCLRECVDRSSKDRYIFTDINDLDICDAGAVADAVKRNEADVIINCAAYTNVDRAEDDAEKAELLNATAVGYLADAAASRGATLIHISTDYVFGGAPGNTPITEDTAPCPIGVYGVTKLHGEEAITRSGTKAVIIRTAWLYSEYGRNFVKTMLELTATRPELNVVFDQAGSPTYARDLASAIVKIVEQRLYEGNEGTYHYSNEGVCSWYDFTKSIAALSGHDRCRIRPCRSWEFPSKVTRPPYSVFDKNKIKSTFGLEIPYWQDSLAECINALTHKS